MEFRRTMLQAISYVLSVARQMLKEGQKNIDLVSLLRRLSAGTAISFSLRNFQRVMLIYSYLLDHFSTFIVPAAMLIDYLEYNLNITIPERFFESIDEYINHTNCDLVSPGAPVGDYLHSRLSCNARRANCSLVSFLQQHQAELQKLELALSAAAPEKVNPRTLAALKKFQVLLHFSDDAVTITKERYYRLLEIEEQYKEQQEETRRLHQLLEEVIHRFEDDPKVIHLRDYLYKRSA
jgi:hypothetical protein